MKSLTILSRKLRQVSNIFIDLAIIFNVFPTTKIFQNWYRQVCVFLSINRYQNPLSKLIIMMFLKFGMTVYLGLFFISNSKAKISIKPRSIYSNQNNSVLNFTEILLK